MPLEPLDWVWKQLTSCWIPIGYRARSCWFRSWNELENASPRLPAQSGSSNFFRDWLKLLMTCSLEINCSKSLLVGYSLGTILLNGKSNPKNNHDKEQQKPNSSTNCKNGAIKIIRTKATFTITITHHAIHHHIVHHEKLLVTSTAARNALVSEGEFESVGESERPETVSRHVDHGKSWLVMSNDDQSIIMVILCSHLLEWWILDSNGEQCLRTVCRSTMIIKVANNSLKNVGCKWSWLM